MSLPRLLRSTSIPWVLLLCLASNAWARGGGGEHYTAPSPDSDSDRGGGGGGDISGILFYLLQLVFRYPKVMLPLIALGFVGYLFLRRNGPGSPQSQRAFQQREAELRTRVSERDITGLIRRVKLKDPAFEPAPMLDRVKWLFLELQKAWFERNLTSVRPFLSDATYQRFVVQLGLIKLAGVRDAITDIEVLEVQIINVNASDWFDTLDVRVKARMRDADAPAHVDDTQALALARRAPLEDFTEVWSFVRKPGALTRIGETLYQGKCPNCGAPFAGGASNTCEFCQAIVNSGNYDWTLSEITQGVEHVRHHTVVDGLLSAREADPALNLEILEDRTSLIFWKWIEAQSQGDAQCLAKLAHAEALQRLEEEFAALRQQGRRRVYQECAVGAVRVRGFEADPSGFDRAQVELRWSARMGTGPVHEPPPALPSVPQCWIFTLLRKHGSQTPTGHGMSTHRCPQCHAPLTDNNLPTCEFCGTVLGSGELDWVLFSALPFETWNTQENLRLQG